MSEKNFCWKLNGQRKLIKEKNPYIGKNQYDKMGRLFIEIKKEKFLGALETTETSDVEFPVTDSKGRYIAGTNRQKGWELVSSKKISGTDWLMTTKVNENILGEYCERIHALRECLIRELKGALERYSDGKKLSIRTKGKIYLGDI